MTIAAVERVRARGALVPTSACVGGEHFDLELEELDLLAFGAIAGAVARPVCDRCGDVHPELRVVFPDSFTAATFGRGRNRMRQATATPGPIVEVYEPGAARGTIERTESPSTRFEILRRARWGV